MASKKKKNAGKRGEVGQEEASGAKEVRRGHTCWFSGSCLVLFRVMFSCFHGHD